DPAHGIVEAAPSLGPAGLIGPVAEGIAPEPRHQLEVQAVDDHAADPDRVRADHASARSRIRRATRWPSRAMASSSAVTSRPPETTRRPSTNRSRTRWGAQKTRAATGSASAPANARPPTSN